MSDHDEDAAHKSGEQHHDDRNKKIAKIQRHFAYSLLSESVNEGWEPHETCQLILLLAKQLNFDSNKILHCVITTNLATPETIAILGDNSIVFEPGQVFDMLKNQAKNSSHFIKIIARALECDILPLYQDETLEKLASILENGWMEGTDAIRYGMTICGFAQTKAICGHILNAFTYAMTVPDAVSYIHDIITRDFFLDLTGGMSNFLPELKKPEVREFLKEILQEGNVTNSKGEIVASDEDSDGNLEGFVAPSDEENTSESDNYFDEEAVESENEYESDDSLEYVKPRSKENGTERSSVKSKQRHKRVLDDTLNEDDNEDNSNENADEEKKSMRMNKKKISNRNMRRRVIADDEEEEEEEEEDLIGSNIWKSDLGNSQQPAKRGNSKIWSDDDDADL